MANEFKVSDLAKCVKVLADFLGDCMVDADKNVDAKISRDIAPVRAARDALSALIGPDPATDTDPAADPNAEPKEPKLVQERAMDARLRRPSAAGTGTPGHPMFGLYGEDAALPARSGHKPSPSLDSIFNGESTGDEHGLDSIFKS
jgi:hypothetical protein